jgi:hypothetical protein
MPMVSAQLSLQKIASCWQTASKKSRKCKGKAFSTLIRVIDVPLPNGAYRYEIGRYRWTIRIEDVHTSDCSVQEVDQVCRHQDLYKLRYEKIFYEKSLLVRRISLIRLIRKIPELLQTLQTHSLFTVPAKDVRILSPKKPCLG